MPIDIGKYNETFKAFADFAKVQLDSGNEKAVARTGAGGAPLGTGLVPFGDAFNADAISGPDILDDLMN